MKRLAIVVYTGLLVASIGCGDSPSSPSSEFAPSRPPSPFDDLVGQYTLTIEIDESCVVIPVGLRTRTYDVVLGPAGYHYLPITIAGERFGQLGGEIWPPTSQGYPFEWNSFDVNGCDYPEPIDSTRLYVCGEGFGTLSDSTMSGVIRGSAFLEGSPRPYCAREALHRFTLARR
jgi:hypothetical protein